jgi:hypothetical protein
MAEPRPIKCGDCGQPIKGVVYRYSGDPPGSYCADCAGFAYRPPRPCEGCGRTVVQAGVHADRLHVCSPECRVKAKRAKRRKRLVYIPLGAAWVVGVHVGLGYLPTSVHHFFQPDYCYQHETYESGESSTTCSPEWKPILSLAIWLGLSAAPFVIVHYYRKRRDGRHTSPVGTARRAKNIVPGRLLGRAGVWGRLWR